MFNFTMEEAKNKSLLDFDATHCGQSDSQTIVGDIKFWFEGVLFMSFGVLGLLSALVSVAILATRDLRSHLFYQLLIALATLDILYILCAVPTYSFDVFKWFEDSETFHHIIATFLYPMTPVTLHASIFVTLALTLERYLAVRKPFWYRNINVSAPCRLATYVLPAVVLSIALNIPKFIEVTVSVENDTLTFDMTAMRKSPNYLLYYTISLLIHPTITTGVAPMVILAFMNASIFLTVHRSNSMRLKMRGTEGQQRQRVAENNLAFVLIGVVVTHFLCHIPRVVIAIAAQCFIGDMISCMDLGESFYPPLWIACGDSVTAMILLVKTSCNLLLYCFTLRRFKAKLNQIGQEGRRQITNFSRQKSTDTVTEI